jgi:hypothetical protein
LWTSPYFPSHFSMINYHHPNPLPVTFSQFTNFCPIQYISVRLSLLLWTFHYFRELPCDIKHLLNELVCVSLFNPFYVNLICRFSQKP